MNRTWILRLVLVLSLASLILAGLALHLWLGTAIAAAVNRVGPSITGTSTSVKAVEASLLRGTVAVHGLVIGNPKGYEAVNAFSVSLVRVGVDWRSLLSDPLVITEITVADPEVAYEGVLSRSNHSVLFENIESNTSTATPADSPLGAAPAKPEPGRKLRIDQFSMTGGRLNLHMGGRPLMVSLPGVELRDIGKEDGVTVDEATGVIAAAVSRAITRAATEAFMKRTGPVGEGASRVFGGVKGLLGHD